MANIHNPNIPHDFQPPKAAQACLTCRKQKRKCDKQLPACSLCRRMNRNCDYSEPRPVPTAEDYEQLRRKVFDLEDRLSSSNGVASINNGYGAVDPYLTSQQSNLANSDVGFSAPISFESSYQEPIIRFPAIALLDSEAFKYGRIQVPMPSIQIPREVTDALGDCHSVEEVMVEYFATIHAWFPFISERRMTLDMVNMIAEAGPDLALLFLCMKLVVTQSHQEGQGAQIPLYYMAKHFLALTETGGMISLNVLQSYLLVALYEFGHALYPTAWMTIGACARYGSLLGITGRKEVATLLGQPATWTELEEHRRTWYTVKILDRCVTVGSLGRSLATEDFRAEDILPADDEAWNNGIRALSAPPNFSTPYTEPAAPFSRLCQATSLLGKAIQNLEDRPQSQVDRLEESLQLRKSVSELTERLIAETNQPSKDYMSLATPLSVSLSALSLISSLYNSRPDHTNSEQKSTTHSSSSNPLTTTAAHIKTLTANLITHTTSSPNPHQNNTSLLKISPLTAHTLYTAATHYAWLVRSNRSNSSTNTNDSNGRSGGNSGNDGDLDGYQEALDSIRFCLRRVGERWRCAAEYLRILEAQEFTYALSGA